MIVLIGFAFLAGIVTILSPCIFPLLPVILSGSVGKSRLRSFGIVAGFTASFTFFTLALTQIVRLFGIPADVLRIAAVILIILFGLTMIVPRFHEWFGRAASRIAKFGRRKPQPEEVGDGPQTGIRGFAAGLPLGISLGLVWTPCVGPIMASVISLALTSRIDIGSVFVTLSYSAGTSIPMLAIMFGGRTLIERVPFLSRNTAKLEKIFGVLMISTGIALGFGLDRQLQAGLLDLFPGYGEGLTAIENTHPVTEALMERKTGGGAMMMTGSGDFSPARSYEQGIMKDFGKAPEIVAGGVWFNLDKTDVITPPSPAEGSGMEESDPRSPVMADFGGRPVLVDFWTYSCINCIRSIPYLKKWYDAYRDDGFLVIGVHTPEFEFEKNRSNVAKAIGDIGVTWPVVLDNDYRQWNAYDNRFWPAHYYIDAKGHVRYVHFGEGDYADQEGVIRALIEETGRKPGRERSGEEHVLTAGTPEIYLGYGRTRGFLDRDSFAGDTVFDYGGSASPSNGEWSLSGKWTIRKDYVIPESTGGLYIGFNAKKVFLVVEPEASGGEIVVSVDGAVPPDTPDVKGGVLGPLESRLYQLVEFQERKQRVMKCAVRGRLRLFTVTFG